MPRKYTKPVESRAYRNYSSEKVDKAVAAVKSGRCSIRHASATFGVPYGTIFNKKNGLHKLRNGGQTMLSAAAEEDLAEIIKIAGEWGYPLTKCDIKGLVQDYMDANNIAKDKRSLPGKDWVYGFLERNKQSLSLRQAQNIKRNRAKVSPETINAYFDKISVELANVPPENIVNYDETNFVDDPESKKAVIRRGQKHADNILDHSKSSYSAMFAAAADGSVLPPYIVYASIHLYASWADGGPKGARYNRSKSGWFDKTIFEDWFLSVALPYFKRLKNDNPRVLIGDNVASHLSYKVVKGCLENNIRFVFLPPNATHLCQPLDVSYFRPLKQAWRKTLDAWKKRHKGSVPKHVFPRLLKDTLRSIQASSAKNVISGFKATGIVPCDRAAVLKRLPGRSRSPVAQPSNVKQENSFSEQLISLLQKERYAADKLCAPKRQRILKIEPGESVGEEHLINFEVDENKNPNCVPKDLPVNATKPRASASKKQQHIVKSEPDEDIIERMGTSVKLTGRTSGSAKTKRREQVTKVSKRQKMDEDGSERSAKPSKEKKKESASTNVTKSSKKNRVASVKLLR